jgi:hypothetical protein
LSQFDDYDFVKRNLVTCFDFEETILTRVALYARFSSDNQRDASIIDQLRACRLYAEKQGWTIVGTYQDRAISGASLVRAGIQELLTDAHAGHFDVVLSEALDRLSRDQEDVAGIFKRMAFADVKIVTLSEGEITHLHVGLKGTMNALFLKDLANKTRRGLRGHVSRGTGVLNNELYAGRIVWNRQRYIKDPSTGRRVSRPNPPHEWVTADVPELQIVDDDLWQGARRHQAALAKVFEATTKGVRDARAKARSGLRRPSYMLSGLLVCGCCSGKYGLVVGDRYGYLNRHRRNTCDNGRTIRRAIIEDRALTGLKEKLVSADAVAEAVRAYHEALNREKQDQRAQSSADRHTLAKVERTIKSIITAIEDGMYQPSMKARMDDLERQKAEITAGLAVETPPLPDVNPNIAEIYRHKVQHRSVALADPKTAQESTTAIRSLIGEIVLTPGEKRGEVHATLRGELMSILDFAAGRHEKRTNAPRVITAVAASPRNH